MKLKIKGVDVVIENFSQDAFNLVEKQLRTDLANIKTKNRTAIQNAFALAIQSGPDANPSDLWHHVIYRLYKGMVGELRGVDDPINSWVRASGDAFELFHADYYNTMLSDTDVRLIPLLGKTDGVKALKRLGIYGKVGDSKLDTAIVKDSPAGMVATLDMPIIGGVHLKASLAERVSDDVPCSQAMMEKGYLSVLATLDVKSFPKSATTSDARAYLNNGELGSPDNPTDKRKYIEDHGSFDAVVSYNQRTVPSPAKTGSGKKIFTTNFSGQIDSFYEMVVSKAKEFK